ncbi:DUF1365 family protein [Siculibacillus lacustris]|uniref:DUF1365 family protein n=1 Tax=Siculibacillus lacustris TaxID=1549641 RepID=A0A4V2KUB0_9HYPH|nr:DUF1365 family protein [Siculibacillus lacustris]TBW40708.1 DUF1365 family protein [Siculibacillus lacustris]
MTPPLASALFPGQVTHLRRRPHEHRLAYRIVSMLIDLDELEALDRRLRLFSVGRFNLFSFQPADRGDRSGRPLRVQIEAAMTAVGVVPDGGPIRVLTMPRVLGWAFNPLSVFFCHRRDESLAAILWEVDNTFGERHAYMIPVEGLDDGEIRQHCDKRFYVSPFMDMDLTYAFRVRPPGTTLSVVIELADAEGPLFTARHLARRVELSDRALLAAALAMPFQALGVVAAIHWQALRLFVKGLRLRPRPAAPTEPVTLVSPEFRSREVHAP